MKYVKIPLDRIGVLIGQNGETKKDIEDKTGIKFNVDSKQGEIEIDENVDNPLMLIKIENIIRAIGRGFSPDHASRLISDYDDFFIFDIHDYVGKNVSHIRRLKSRVIGREGKTKHVLERLTDSYISVYGHTISVIANINHMDVIKRALDMLMNGSRHSTVYRFVERNMKKIKIQEKYDF
jgi:ribosomal RNA assembly protein